MSGSANLGLCLHPLAMIPLDQQSNEPLIPKQTTLVLRNISSRQKELRYTDEVIEEEELKSAANAAAIAHLEPAISRAQLAIAAQKQALADLTKLKAVLEEANVAAGPNWAEMSEAKELCGGAMSRVESQLMHSLEKLTCQISQFENNIPTLCTSLREMELELYGQRLMQDASIQHIASLGVHRNAIEENIKLLKLGLNPVKNTPAEVWAKIFAVRVNADMETYFANPTSKLIPSVTMKLSQVCRFWRRVAYSEKSLWRFMAIYPDAVWLPSKVELLKHLRSFNSGPPALVYDLTQATTWTGTTHQYSNGRFVSYAHRTVTAISASDISMFNTYSLRLLAYGHNAGLLSSAISFRQPKSLTVQFTSSTSNVQWLADLLGPISGFSSLEIVSQAVYASAAQIFTTHTQITYLKLDLTTFQPFDISGYLGPNLEELHLTHNGVNTLMQNTTVRLPKLRILGVTPPDTEFTRHLELPKLTRLILYGPKLSTITVVSLVGFAASPAFRKLQHLELRGWSLFRPTTGGEWSVMVPLNEAIDKMRSVVTLSCIDSYIEGGLLVDFVTILKDTTMNPDGSMLEMVVVDCCSGITRDDCEVIATLVGKTEVYV